jgi:hypothetical protein
MGLYSKPPGKEKLERARALRLKERQMAAIIREIILHFMVVILVLFVAYGNHDDKSFSYSRRAIKLLTEGFPAFTKVSVNVIEWISYSRASTVPVVFCRNLTIRCMRLDKTHENNGKPF